MTGLKARRAPLGGLLVLALGALTLLALPGMAAAKAKDRNHDRIPDRWEKRHHLSLKVEQTRRDQDHDQLANLGEFKAGDNPRDDDSDNDGIEDGAENAGTIASFDMQTGKLTINLFGGETASGLVTEGTEIECDRDGGAAASREDGGGRQAEDDGPSHEVDNDDGPGHETGDDDGPDHEAEGANCNSADLLAGAVVSEAELQLENGVATFSKVELGNSNG
jgi:hypothetical protein